MEKDNDMDAFIRDTLNSYQRIREKNFTPIQQSVVTRSSTNITSASPPSAEPVSTSATTLGGGSDQFPFQITTIGGRFPRYKVSYNSSIINGTNGKPYNIVGLNEEKIILQNKFIIAEAKIISSSLTVEDGFTIKEVDVNETGAKETDEILTENENVFGVTRPVQKKLRLFIGKITFEGADSGIKLKAWQAITTSYRTVVGIHNSIPVLVLEPAPTHHSRV